MYDFTALQAWIIALYQTMAPGQNLAIVPYGYTVSVTGLAQGNTQTAQLAITANADFVMTEVRHRASIGAAQTIGNKPAPFVRMLVTDNSSNEQLTAQAVDLENFSCNGTDANFLPYPRFVSGRSSLTVQLTNWAPVAETYALDVFFVGVLVRQYSVPQGVQMAGR